MEFIKKLLSWFFSSYLMRSIIPYEIRKIFYVAEDMVDLKNTMKEKKESTNKSQDYDDDDWDDDEEEGPVVDAEKLKNILIPNTESSIGQLAAASMAISKLTPEESQRWGQDPNFQNEFLSKYEISGSEYTVALQACTSNATLSEIYSAVMSGQAYKKDISEFKQK